MCKVLIIPSIKEAKKELTIKFIKAMATKISVGNSDGLGYAAVTNTGELFAERWFDNSKAFTYSTTTEVATNLYDKFSSAVRNPRPTDKVNTIEYSSFNSDWSLEDAVSITLHARFATCEKSLMNVHPFIKDDTSVIHNGIIRNYAAFNLEQSTCDSESILLGYLANGVSTNTGAIQSMVSEFIGYYVTGVYSRDAKGNRILDVFNGNNPNLHLIAIKELETYIMTTSDYDAESVCRDMGLTITETYQMMDDQFLRLNPFTGDVIEHHNFRSGQQFETTKQPYQHSQHTGWRTYQGPSTLTTTETRSKRKNISEMELNYLMKQPKIAVLSHEEGMKFINMMNLKGA